MGRLAVEPLRTEQDIVEFAPAWVRKLVNRLAKLERGQVYTLTVVLIDDEPVWGLQAVARLENDR